VADSIKIEVKGIKELQKNFKQAEAEIRSAIMQGLRLGGDIVVFRAKERVSVKTGNLKSKIKEQKAFTYKDQVQVNVGVTGVPYAARLEYGYTGPDKLGRRFHQKPRPYLRNSLDEKEKVIVAIVESKVKEVVRRYA